MLCIYKQGQNAKYVILKTEIEFFIIGNLQKQNFLQFLNLRIISAQTYIGHKKLYPPPNLK